MGSLTGDSDGEALDAEAFAAHLERPLAIGHTPAAAATGAAGGAACGDLVRISLSLQDGCLDGRIADAGFDASGCGATIAAGSATIALLRGSTLLDAARIGPEQIAAELGGLSAAKQHAAELACDALHRALGLAARGAALAPRPDRTLVAMSGGVDSAVAALIVARESGDTVGVTLELWADAENDAELSCCSAQAVRSARALAHRLGLPHLSIDLRAEFAAGVVAPWLADHAAGLTPYACVRCNGEVRLDGMLELAGRLGAQTLVTGHYARVRSEAASTPLLRVAVDEGKDQSYALASLAAESLARLRFPLGELRKGEVRELAREAGLAVARKRDSQDLCFLAGTNQRAFLARHGGVRARRGEVRDTDGAVLGGHDGTQDFTIGQRRGLGLGGGQPRYVLATDIEANTVTVGAREQLLTGAIEMRDAVLRCDGAHVDAVKIRYRGRRLPCEPPLAGELPVAGEPPVAGQPPLAGELPVAGEPPVAGQPPLAGELPVAGEPPVAGQPPLVGESPVVSEPAAARAIDNAVGKTEDAAAAGSTAAAGAHQRLLVRLVQPVERTAPGQLACLYAGDVLVGHGMIASR